MASGALAVTVRAATVRRRAQSRRNASTASTRRWESGSSLRPRDLANMGLDGLGTQVQPLVDRAVAASLRDQLEHLALAVGEQGERAFLTRAPDEPRDDRRIDHALALGDPLWRVCEHGDVRNALLEQMPTRCGCSSSRRIA
jgi:hypothetical protein